MQLQAGTLSGNPLAMTAGIKTLQILERPGTYEYLDKITGRLVKGIIDAAHKAGHACCGGHIGGGTLSVGVSSAASTQCDQLSQEACCQHEHAARSALASSLRWKMVIWHA